MRKFEVHYMVMDIAMGAFETLDEALLFVDSLRKNIKKICIAHNSNCLFYISISISEEEQIRRTSRGGKLIDDIEEKLPHIHGICLVEKQSFIAHKIVDYLKTTQAIIKFKQQHPTNRAIFTEAIHKPDELKTRLIYRVSQAYKFRIVNTCTEEFAKRYAGDFVSMIEEKEKSMGGSKLVFPKYANLELGTDDSVFDFSGSNNQKPTATEVWNDDIEMWKEINDGQALFISSEKQDNTPFLPQNSPNQAFYGGCSPNSNPTDNVPYKCNIKLIYNTLTQSTDYNYYNPF